MRNPRLLVAAGLLSAAIASAQEPAPQPHADRSSIVLPGEARPGATGLPAPASTARSAELEFTVLDSLINAFSYYTGQQQPLVWDPASNLTVTIMRGSPRVEGESNNLYIRTSTDRGRTWAPRIGPLHDVSAGAGRYPSVAISNPTNSANIADVLIFYSFPLLSGAGDAFGGFAYGIAQAIGGDPVLTITNTGLDGATYGTDSKPVVIGNGLKAVVFGNVSGDAFAVRIISFDGGTETAFIPEQFAGSTFRPGTATGRFSTAAGLDKDAEDNLYAGVLAYPADFTASTRLRPAVSKSTDDGETWSALDYAPETLIGEYAASIGYLADSVSIDYDSDFLVSGPDRVHFLAKMLAFNAEVAEAPVLQQMIEIYRENGTWKVMKAADVRPFRLLLRDNDEDTLAESQMGLEGQLERSADGRYLVVKYLDFAQYIVDGDHNGDGQQPDTTSLTTDIMVAKRAITAGRWDDPVNITESVLLDRVTWIPNILPNDLKDITLLTVQNRPTGTDESDSARLIGSQRKLIDQTQLVTTSRFDAAVTTGVRTSGTVAARALAIYPNPAIGETRAAFTIPAAGAVSVRIHDVTGREVFSLPARHMSAGDHAIDLNTSTLNNGVYYYSVSFNGSIASTMFTVVR